MSFSFAKGSASRKVCIGVFSKHQLPGAQSVPPDADNAPGTHVLATIFEVFAGHQIGCELKAISHWLDGQRVLVSLVANDLRREGLRQTERRGLPAETVLRYAILKQQRQLSYKELAFHCAFR
jgi:hypothetical protein